MGDSLSSGGRANGVLARIAHSAEYSIAAALIAVCVVVGGALWLLGPEEEADRPAAATAPARPSAVPAADERAAIEDWNRRLGEELGALDDAQRKRAAEEEGRRARQRADEAAAEARRQADLAAAQARQQAERNAREQAAVPEPATAKPAPRRQPVISHAAIDWSSCRRPSYPRTALDRGHEGVVTIAVDLDAAAKIQQARVAQSSGHGALDRATLEAIRRCRFAPMREDGVAKAATAEVRFVWKLEN